MSAEKQLAESLEDILSCVLCMERFTETGARGDPTKNAKILVCLHSYCKGCLAALLASQGHMDHIDCPSCHKPTAIDSQRGVEGLTNNFLIQGLIAASIAAEAAKSAPPIPAVGGGGDRVLARGGGSASSAEGGELICGMCTGTPNPATCGCLSCNEGTPMCDTCLKTIHSAVPAFRDHKVVSSVEYSIFIRSAKKIKCPKHKSNDMELFCESCNEAVCSTCCVVTHKDHRVSELLVVAEREKAKIQATSAEYRGHLGRVLEEQADVQKKALKFTRRVLGHAVQLFFSIAVQV